jgi:hypothetical protein
MKQTAEQYAEKIMEVAYFNFPLVKPKETVHKIITALITEYARNNECTCFSRYICDNCKD